MSNLWNYVRRQKPFNVKRAGNIPEVMVSCYCGYINSTYVTDDERDQGSISKVVSTEMERNYFFKRIEIWSSTLASVA